VEGDFFAEFRECLGAVPYPDQPGGEGSLVVGVFDFSRVFGQPGGGLLHAPGGVVGAYCFFECAHEVDGLGFPEFDQYRVGQGAVGEGVLFAGGHAGHEGPHERFHRAAGGQRVAQVVLQPVHVHGGVPVQGGGVELDGADHAGAGFFLVLIAVVHGGVVDVLVLHRVDADGVRDLGGGVDVEVGDVGDHPP